LANAVLLHVPDGEQFEALANSPRLRPYLSGQAGAGWLLVRDDAREELTTVLAELGFPLAPQLTPENSAKHGSQE
jgi:hypothetical protein